MRLAERAPGTAVAAAALAALTWASSVSTAVHQPADAVLRLAWSARPERIEQCRQRTEEELAKLPRHMRQPMVCEGASAQYRLTVKIDGRLVTDRIVSGGGLRRDRKLYVFQELPLEPGEAGIEVRFDRVDPDTPGSEAGDAQRADGIAPVAAAESIPPNLALTERLRIREREVVLVTYAVESRMLVAVRHDP